MIGYTMETIMRDERDSSGDVLWWERAAARWDYAVPIGNGRIGGLVYGDARNERIGLNEETLWSGGPRDCNNPSALEALPEVRRLLFEGRPVEAEKLANEKMLGVPAKLRPYQTLGDLWFDMRHRDDAADYRLSLDMDEAVARVAYRVGGTRFVREAFVNHPSNVMVVQLRAEAVDKTDGSLTPALSFDIRLTRNRDAATNACTGHGAWPARLVMRGQLDGGAGLLHACHARVQIDGGEIYAVGSRLCVRNARSATILLTAATNYRSDDPEHVCVTTLDNAGVRGAASLREEHAADHRSLYRRMSLALHGPGEAPEVEALPTNRRIERVRSGRLDPGLVAQYVRFGRYLLIASSRSGTLPANLQGVWADGFNPPWESDYHLNINIQMNYWPAEVCAVSETADALVSFILQLREFGRRTARVHYGCRGWMAHHITDIWGFTVPADGAGYGLWPMGGAWLCLHLWERWLFRRDRNFLAQVAYPVIKEAAEFFLDYLVEDGKGRLVGGPSSSPENRYRLPNGEVGWLVMGSSIDTQMTRGLFTQVIEASKELDCDAEFRSRCEAARAKLPPMSVGKYGQIMEWSEDYDEWEPGHRHVSHLFALHPSDQITTPPGRRPDDEPFMKAARATLDRRLAHGGGHTGWSRAWIINFWARLRDASKAHENIIALLSKSTLPNLWDDHPPFQIDGNFGGAAGVAEMLLQSHGGVVRLLPALPKEWPSGGVVGLRARGNIGVDITWDANRLTRASLRAESQGDVVLIAGEVEPLRVIDETGVAVGESGADGAARWRAMAGKTYLVTLK